MEKDDKGSTMIRMGVTGCMFLLSVTGQCSIEMIGWIKLVFGVKASFDQSYTVF